MPFDVANFKTKNHTEVKFLQNMKITLATPDKWCKGKLQEGNAFCLIGAISENGWNHSVYKKLDDICKPLYPKEYNSVVPFNNADSTTHEDIINLLDKAIESFQSCR